MTLSLDTWLLKHTHMHTNIKYTEPCVYFDGMSNIIELQKLNWEHGISRMFPQIDSR